MKYLYQYNFNKSKNIKIERQTSSNNKRRDYLNMIKE